MTATAQSSGDRRVAVISGGSRGLGAALAAHFLENDVRVATFSKAASEFIDRRQEQDPKRQCFLWDALDASDARSLDDFVMRVAMHWGRIDLLINNAAVLVEQVMPLMRPADVHRIIAVNLESAIHLSRSCVKAMLRADAGGNIINISSLNGVRGFSGVTVYSAAKAGLDGFTRSLARELGPRGIRVNSVAPGYFESAMAENVRAERLVKIVRRTPLRRVGTVVDIVAAVQFLASPAAAFITGQTLVVDGGLTC
jgi:3-oxoacyl-[acyl-carrier protein] reductase